LKGLGHCGACHTPKNITGGDRGSEALQGALLQDWYAPDLTEDPRTGIGRWSIEEIVRYLKTGANSYDIASGPMAEAVTNSTSPMTDADLLAIATYLRDRAPRSGSAVTALAPGDSRMVAGKAVYEDRCAACHVYSGASVPTLFPRLAGAPLVLRAASSNRSSIRSLMGLFCMPSAPVAEPRRYEAALPNIPRS